jgi:hypothetical protein
VLRLDRHGAMLGSALEASERSNGQQSAVAAGAEVADLQQVRDEAQ